MDTNRKKDMKNNTSKYIRWSFLIFCFMLGISSCKKDDYYRDGGLASGDFKGNMLEYLESKPKDFDTIVQVIKLAGMEETFRNEELTFFAPNDKLIRETIKQLNPELNRLYLDTVVHLSDVKPEIWAKYLSRYLFKGAYQLADYTQIDFDLINTFPGQNYFSYDGTVLNVGVVYEPANGVKYLGYRRLVLSYIPDISKPKDSWMRTNVSSSDIHPNNGFVHTLAYDGKLFGFSFSDFFQDVLLSKR